jgi:hypothetical protein
MNNADNILFRCSSLGKIMTNPQTKSETLSETCKSHLSEVFVTNVYGRKKDISNKYIEKGLQVEEDAITLFSRIEKTVYLKNVENIRNAFISGTPDLYAGESIHKADVIIDTKSSWDIYTFFATKDASKLNKMYYWQLQGYMWLTGAQTSKLAYCLVNTPDTLIEDEKRKLAWKMGVIDEMANPDYLEAVEQIEKLGRYDDIHFKERCNIININRDSGAIEQLEARVIACRQWMNTNLFKTNR